MDAIDREILAQLQVDGRLTITDLAQRVGLSVSPAHRRMRDLERAGVIQGYRATIAPAKVNLGFETLVFITMHDATKPTIAAFEAAVTAIPQITLAQRLFGDPDYLLRVVTADLAHFQNLYDEQLSALPGVQRLNTTLVMKKVVDDRPLPL
ncbi:Lrp/AsnC family transcriptional regulator [Microbacterium sp. B2969]|uniref:Lrp/AsnC family transcriptional regulator n=1 Tax=Microbacterium alkaliflavum TaxID=3248839 RepID=A0ABW7QEB2_9MICO